jgi:hypothetical protein
MNERRLARAIRAEQSCATAVQRPADIMEDPPLAEYYSQLIQLNYWLNYWLRDWIHRSLSFDL